MDWRKLVKFAALAALALCTTVANYVTCAGMEENTADCDAIVGMVRKVAAV